MKLISKISLYLILFTASQLSFAQLYEIDEYNGQTINTCGGTFQDSNAGSNGNNYSNNENYSITICPENSGQNIELDFTAFSTQLNADILTIYDGPDNSGTGTTYSGNATQSPGFISATNDSGCLTIEFFSNAAASTIGWSANISCFEPCQEILGFINDVSPAPNEEGQVTVCPGEEITFNASGEFSNSGDGATFNWEFGDGTTAEGQTVTKTYDQSGIFSAGLIITDPNPLGCSSLQVTQIVIVAPSIDFSGTEAGKTDLCFGDSTTLFGVAESTQLEDCAPEIFEETWLEDTQTTGQQASYESTISVECYADGLEFTDISQLIQICVVIEHSFIGDLDMLLTAPNGQSVYFAQYGDGNDPGTSLGIPDELDNGNPGIGWEYCFTPTSTLDISSTGGTNVPEGIYGASNGSSFNDLLGTSLNGDWTFTVIDSWAADDGTIFSWNLDFDPALSAPPSEIIIEEWLEDPSIISIDGNNIIISPTQSGENCYTYFVQDDFGCEYYETICVNVEEEIINDTPNNLFICDALTTDFIYDFTDNESLISSIAPDPDNLVISFYETFENAEQETSPIIDYTNYNGEDGQTIHVRVEYLDSNCFELESFTLNVINPPVINVVEPIVVCDDPSNDGFVNYDLTTINDQILGDQSANDYNINYFDSYENAYNDINSLSMPYPISNSSELWVRIEGIGASGCFNVSEANLLNFQINPADDSSFEMTSACDGGTATITGLAGGTFAFDTPPIDGAIIDEVTGTITGGGYDTTYSVSYTTNGDCPTTTTILLTSNEDDDSSFEMTPTCDGGTATITGLAGGTFAFDTPPIDGAIIDEVTGTITGGGYDTTYSVSYTTNGDCPTTTIVVVTSIVADDSSFEMTPTCDGGTATITGLAGGTFAFDTPPIDGAIIDEVTGTITGGGYDTTYSVSYTTNGDCPTTTTILLTSNEDDDSSFEMTPTCDGGTATITGLAGGTFAFDTPPIDGAIIDEVTGTITGGGYDTTYSVSYTTNGDCPTTTIVVVTSIVADDSSFEMTPTCDGGTATITGLAGGTFAFDTPPIDGAIIDEVTGTITGGGYDTTYSVSYTTNGDCPTTTIVVVTSIVADDSSFEMTPTCDGGTATITGLAGGTFAFDTPPIDGAIIDEVTGTITGGGYDTTYSVSYTTNGDCPTTSIIDFSSAVLPVISDPTPFEVCDDNIADGFTEMDLNIKNTEITNGNPNYAVTYYLTSEEANSGENPLSVPYTNIDNPQTIFIRVVDITFGCFVTTSMDLTVQSAPAATTPSNLQYCDADADGFGVFNLTDADAEITSGESGLVISYHETQSDAENNLFPIVGDYNNIVAYEQTIYVRVESATITTSCATYLELIIVVDDVPQIETDPSPLEVCDNDTDGFGLFDLSLANEEILNGLDPLEFAITYYETPENAELGENPIVTPLAYTNVAPFTQEVYVRVENNETLCYNTTALTLIVNELPVLVQPDPLELCDDNNTGDEVEEFTLEDSLAQVLNGQTGISITFYETQEDADNADNPITSPYTNTVNAQTIYLRAENDITGCVSTITLDLRVNPLPSPVTVEPLEACDVDADGFTSFDLESVSEEIINGELDIFVTYFETLADAQNAVNPLASPYDNIAANEQTLFVRAENILTTCFSIVELDLVTLPSPQLPIVIDDIIICDDDLNGFFQFDLTQNTTLILGDQVASEFNLSYHITQEDADTGDNPIVNPETYNNLSNPQTIFVRLENIENLCVSTGVFDLIVALPPDAIQPLPLELCDDTVADETTVFDLTVKDEEITGGNPWIVAYYETQEDAELGQNVIEDPEAYTNTAIGTNALNPQTLFVRVTDPATTCYSFVTLTIRVLPNPTPSIDPSNIEFCDYDTPGDQLEIFDITINEAYIINGEEGVSVTYHETQEDAELGQNAIVDPTVYTNITLGQQTIYVRVTNDITACYTIVTFDLIVNPLPDVSAADDYIACEVNTDGFFDFDLETVTATILGTQDPLNFTVTYHETQEEADNGENALVSPYTNLTNPQELFVNITNDITGCFIAVPSITIEVQEAAQANSDFDRIDHIICDNIGDNDGFGSFDLTVNDDEVLDGQDPTNFTVTYYETQVDAEAGVNAITDAYENITNPQVIFARVDNDTTADAQCFATTTLTLTVNLLPIFDLEDTYLGCVNVNGSELLDPVVMDIGLDPGLYSFEWFDPTGTLVSTNVTYTPLVGGVFTAVATNLATGCQNSDTTLVDASSPPEVSAVVTTEFFADIHIIEASATGEGNYEFSLDDGPWQNSGTFNDVTPGFHTVVGRDINGCGTATTQVLVIDYPHFFTPNGDGYNDTWRIEGIETRPLSKIYIYDRYGKLLKQLNPLGPGWDGTFNGENLPATDYWFTVRLDVIFGDQESLIKEFRGHFSLKR